MLHYFRKYAAAGCLTIVLTLGASSPYAQSNEEYRVKAAYIYNFIKFAEWSGEHSVNRRSSIDVCIVGDSDLIQTKPVFAQGSTPKLSISLVQESNIKNIAEHCHIAFISESESAALADILTALKGKPVLTVSDIEGFPEKGGMIGFVLVDKKIKLVVNTNPVAAAGLRIDAQLLEIALKVIDR